MREESDGGIRGGKPPDPPNFSSYYHNLSKNEVNRIIGIFESNTVDGFDIDNSNQKNENIPNLISNVNVSKKQADNSDRPRYQRLYNVNDTKPFIVVVESEKNNIGKYTELKIAREILSYQLTDVEKKIY